MPSSSSATCTQLVCRMCRVFLATPWLAPFKRFTCWRQTWGVLYAIFHPTIFSLTSCQHTLPGLGSSVGPKCLVCCFLWRGPFDQFPEPIEAAGASHNTRQELQLHHRALQPWPNQGASTRKRVDLPFVGQQIGDAVCSF